MFDRLGIFGRFISVYETGTQRELARKIGVSQQTVSQWAKGTRPVPWLRLKAAVDKNGLSWDWMLEGRYPKFSGRKKLAAAGPFDFQQINLRFLALYPGLSNAKLGQVFGLSAMSVFRWRHNLCQVPWERLKQAADSHGTSWEWLLAGQHGKSGDTPQT